MSIEDEVIIDRLQEDKPHDSKTQHECDSEDVIAEYLSMLFPDVIKEGTSRFE